MMLSKLFFKKRPDRAAAELRVVPPVTRLHGNCNEHVNTLADRIDEVIQEFGDEVRSRGGFVTNAEVLGTLVCLQHDYLTGKR